MSDAGQRRAFLASAAFLLAMGAFAYGLAVGQYRVWPHATLQEAWDAARSLAKHGEIIPDGRLVRPHPAAPNETFTVHRPDSMGDGYYVFVGYESAANMYAAWLYSSQGELEHTWPIDYLAVDPDGPSNGADNPHPFHVLSDGSIIAGFDKGDVMVRLDTCGTPIWVKDGIYHHSLSRGVDGSFWVWRGEGTAYGHYNYLVNFDPETGDTIREIGLIEEIVRPMGELAVVFGVRPDYPFQRFDRDPANQGRTDIFHPNDLDVLHAELAPMFPLFEAGDLLLSFRTLNLVAVIDPDDLRLKWWSHGPWIGQHDPDFTADGWISVYNNNTGRDRSEIISIHPSSREVRNELFNGELEFLSNFMGKHQYLPNGNVLIVSPGEGRIVEVTRHGDMVMQFNNLSDKPMFREHVENGMWVSADYFQNMPRCPGQSSKG